MIGLFIFLVFVAAVFYAVTSKDRQPPAPSRPLPVGSVQMPLDMLHTLMDDLDSARHHAARLRRGMEKLIHEWPIVFSPEELETAKALVNEAVEVGL
jgi:hypothetical protein